MRLSRLFFTSLRTVAAGHETQSHQLLLRAGYLRQLGQGLFSALPLAQRTLAKIEGILREEMQAIGGQELLMPVVQPIDLWQRTGRYNSIGNEMVRFTDCRNRPMLLAMTHEEVATDLCRSVIGSYRQLPQSVFQIQTKFRDEPRPRAGLIRVREFRMKDAYSFAVNSQDLDKQYDEFILAYQRIFERCQLPTLTVKADVGMMGGTGAHEFMYLTPVGEDTLVICNACGYSANRQVATAHYDVPSPETLLAVEKIETPQAISIEALTSLLNITAEQTAKAVFFMGSFVEGEDSLVFALVRGDMEVNETKLTNVVGATELRVATEDEIRATGAVPGYASPIGVTACVVVVDRLLTHCSNLVTGANEEGFHLKNVNVERDMEPDHIADIVSVKDGDRCEHCHLPVQTSRGVEVANTFKLGTRYSQSLGATVKTADGKESPVVMGSYGIGVGRLLACIAEEHHDERGLIWPESVAPFNVHLVAIGNAVMQDADRLYEELTAAGIDVLYDDRDESAGVKLADADLIGVPVRLIIGKRSVEQGGVEFVRRRTGESTIVPRSEVLGAIGPT